MHRLGGSDRRPRQIYSPCAECLKVRQMWRDLRGKFTLPFVPHQILKIISWRNLRTKILSAQLDSHKYQIPIDAIPSHEAEPEEKEYREDPTTQFYDIWQVTGDRFVGRLKTGRDVEFLALQPLPLASTEVKIFIIHNSRGV